LALGNHLLTLFVAPCIAVFVVWVGRHELRVKPWGLAAAAVACVAGMSVYLYVPIAASQSPPLPYNHPVTWDGVWWLVSGTQFRGQFNFLTPNGPADLVASLPALWTLVSSQATPVVPILGLAGLALLVRRRPAFGLMCVAILVTHVYIWSTYLRLEHYLLVAWLILAIGAAVALDATARWLAAHIAKTADRGRQVEAVVGAIAVVFALWLGVTNWGPADRSGDRTAETYVDTVLQALPADAAILTQWDASTPLWHATLVLGRRPDLFVVDDTNIVYEGWGSRENRIASLICERPVYILRLNDQDLVPTRELYRLEESVLVNVAQGGPSAAVNRFIFRVAPRDPNVCTGEAGSSQCSVEVEHLLEALVEARRFVGERIDQMGHLGLPASVDRAVGHRVSERREVIHDEVREEVRSADEDRVIATARGLERGEHLRPDGRMPAPIFVLLAGQDPHREPNAFH
jgi:hypothetical protein